MIPVPLRHRRFRWFFAARLLTMLAHSATVICLGWLVYDLARQTMDVRAAAFRLGLIGAVQFLPFLLFSPFAGYVADRFNRRRVVMLSLTAQMASIAAVGLLVWSGKATLPTLYILAAFIAAARSFYMPANNALTPKLVPPEILPNAIALYAISGRVGAIIGPTLGGFVFAVSPWGAFGFSAVLLALAVTGQLIVGPIEQPPGTGTSKPLGMIRDGFRYVVSNRMLLGAISLDMFSVLLGGVTAMLPVFARDILQAGPEGLGLLRTAPSIGAVLTGVWLSMRPLRSGVGVKMLIAVAIFGVCTVVFGLSTHLPLSIGCLVVLGAADMISVNVRQSLVTIATPDTMRGRVGAVSTLFISASNELGEMESGALAAAIGPVGSVVVGGTCAVGIAVAWAKLFPELRHARDFNPPQPNSSVSTPA
ncbi:MFS transporter [Niveispirillum cyanobacteriorum]|uniref:MFS transporter n=1 Tax=Niveispirillum cyanobacteriorum TaxID=1612173 RepID=A0A2K9NHT9_9PROT|nr:MFS transporter [Niveispirillum cyanobacteriorum]AUN32631.1 MFS transporter [Niveispirillum cyanobacteriorum]GGE76505.1 MFS transporter [Niveispirillum cyanobacteriorum]